MNKILFWGFLGVEIVLLIVQMINVIPLLKKGITEEEKEKRYPKTVILNSLMLLVGGVVLFVLNETLSRILGATFSCIGFLNLLFSIKNKNEEKNG